MNTKRHGLTRINTDMGINELKIQSQKTRRKEITKELGLEELDLRARLDLALIALDDIPQSDQVKLLNMISFCLSIPLKFEPQKKPSGT